MSSGVLVRQLVMVIVVQHLFIFKNVIKCVHQHRHLFVNVDFFETVPESVYIKNSVEIHSLTMHMKGFVVSYSKARYLSFFFINSFWFLISFEM